MMTPTQIRTELRKLAAERKRLCARLSSLTIREGQLKARLAVAAATKNQAPRTKNK
jgi:hypothetical protein